MSAKIRRARSHNIELEYSIVLDDELYVDQFDIAMILANALDNAIEGAERSDDVDKHVSLNICRASNYISIYLENTATGPVANDFMTTKPDKRNHGFGMAQMKDIAAKYKGSFQPEFMPEEKLFTLNIMLYNRQF